MDDKLELLEIGSKISEIQGYSVSLAQNGTEAVERFQESDLILRNGMDGM